MTCFLTLDPDAPHPVVLRSRVDTNNAETFLNDVREVAAANPERPFFKPRRIFAMDNATVHTEGVTFFALGTFFFFAHVTRITSMSSWTYWVTSMGPKWCCCRLTRPSSTLASCTGRISR
jgi:hypothetical protein